MLSPLSRLTPNLRRRRIASQIDTRGLLTMYQAYTTRVPTSPSLWVAGQRVARIRVCCAHDLCSGVCLAVSHGITVAFLAGAVLKENGAQCVLVARLAGCFGTRVPKFKPLSFSRNWGCKPIDQKSLVHLSPSPRNFFEAREGAISYRLLQLGIANMSVKPCLPSISDARNQMLTKRRGSNCARRHLPQIETRWNRHNSFLSRISEIPSFLGPRAKAVVPARPVS